MGRRKLWAKIRYWPFKLNVCIRGGLTALGGWEREKSNSGVNSLAQFPAARIFPTVIGSGPSGGPNRLESTASLLKGRLP